MMKKKHYFIQVVTTFRDDNRGGGGGGRGTITSAIWVAPLFRAKINEATKRATSRYIRASNGVFCTCDMYKQHTLMRRCGLRYKEVITERQAGMWYKMRARGSRVIIAIAFCVGCCVHRYNISSYYCKRTRVWLQLITTRHPDTFYLFYLHPQITMTRTRLSSKCKICTANQIVRNRFICVYMRNLSFSFELSVCYRFALTNAN